MPVMRNQTAYKPFYEALGGDVRLYLGDVRAVLKNLPAQSVHCVITSPPYWGLRDYGTAKWKGGDPDCDHDSGKTERRGPEDATAANIGYDGNFQRRLEMAGKRTGGHFGNECKKCGAKRIDQQIGSEPTPDEFVATMVDVFREVRRVLRDDGTVWLNLGDTYAASGYSENRSWEQSEVTHASNYSRAFRDKMENNTGKNIKVKTGMAAGNLVGIPWRVALALQADSWILRQDIIWHKVAPMPESVSDRCTKAHEYIFLLCKRKPYYYDAEAIKEVTVTAPHKPGWAKSNRDRQDAQPDNEANHREWGGQNRNKRSVWTVSSQGYEGSHFACFPQKLIEPCILAGVPEKCCSQCGAPHLRLTEKTQLTRERPNDYVKRTGEEGTGNSCANSVAGVNTKTIGWQPQCDCNASVVGGTVLDPFVGSGTTVVVALQNNRKGIGIDLSQTYLLDNAIPRIEGACHDMPELAKRLGKQAKVLTGGTLLKR